MFAPFQFVRARGEPSIYFSVVYESRHIVRAIAKTNRERMLTDAPSVKLVRSAFGGGQPLFVRVRGRRPPMKAAQGIINVYDGAPVEHIMDSVRATKH
jgi:hypothetical protein